MRNIGEHADEYAVDSPKRHVKTLGRKQLEVGSWDGQTFKWGSVRFGFFTLSAKLPSTALFT
jgi:hypothetical protein